MDSSVTPFHVFPAYLSLLSVGASLLLLTADMHYNTFVSSLKPDYPENLSIDINFLNNGVYLSQTDALFVLPIGNNSYFYYEGKKGKFSLPITAAVWIANVKSSWRRGGRCEPVTVFHISFRQTLSRNFLIG